MRSPHTSYRRRGERIIEPIKWMRSPHTSYRWRGESHRANQVDALATHQLQVESEERVIETIKCMRLTTPASGGEEREDIEPIKCMCSPTHQLQVERRESHRANQVDALATPSYRWRGESHRANQVDALTTHQLQGRGERVIEPIKCMRSPHTSYRCRERENHRANQVYALTTHQLQVERGERHRANRVNGDY